jgi:hypothetical protein
MSMAGKKRQKTTKNASATEANAARKPRKLKLDRETLKDLDALEPGAVRGGSIPGGYNGGTSSIT